jgi:hypothetical protein
MLQLISGIVYDLALRHESAEICESCQLLGHESFPLWVPTAAPQSPIHVH